MFKKAKNFFLIIVFCITNFVLIGQVNYYLLWDDYFSSIVGGENILTIHKAISEFEDDKLELSYWNNELRGNRLLNTGYRLTKTFLLDIQIDFLLYVTQHEVFGHGSRNRAVDIRNNTYAISPLFPYGNGSGAIFSVGANNNRIPGVHERISGVIGGMEGSSILGYQLRKKWLIRENIHYRESLLYLLTANDYSLYTWRTKLISLNQGDVNNYLSLLNTTLETKMNLDRLFKRSSFSILNTYNFLAAYAYFKTYLIDGQQTSKLFSIPLRKVKWIPSARFGLTPFGSEYILENHFITSNDIWEIQIGFGDNRKDNYCRISLDYWKRLNSSLQMRTILSFWKQPKLELGGVSIFETKGGFGGHILLELSGKFSINIPVGFNIQAGYKTSGFLPGEILGRGSILRIGFLIQE